MRGAPQVSPDSLLLLQTRRCLLRSIRRRLRVWPARSDSIVYDVLGNVDWLRRRWASGLPSIETAVVVDTLVRIPQIVCRPAFEIQRTAYDCWTAHVECHSSGPDTVPSISVNQVSYPCREHPCSEALQCGGPQIASFMADEACGLITERVWDVVDPLQPPCGRSHR